jgi:hypothetical protein
MHQDGREGVRKPLLRPRKSALTSVVSKVRHIEPKKKGKLEKNELEKNAQTVWHFTQKRTVATAFFVISENASRRARGRDIATFFRDG